MAKDVKVYTGTDWRSIKGPQGDAGVPGPTQVSADPKNVAEIGGDGLLKVDGAKLDAKYVLVAGDTMTGALANTGTAASHFAGSLGVGWTTPTNTLEVGGEAMFRDKLDVAGNTTITGILTVAPEIGPLAPNGSIQVVAQDTNANITIERAGDTSIQPALRFKRSRGTLAAPTSVQNADNLGALGWHATRADGAIAACGNILMRCTQTPLAGENNLHTDMRFAVGTGTGTQNVLILAQPLCQFNVPVGVTQSLTVGGSISLGGFEVVANTTTFVIRRAGRTVAPFTINQNDELVVEGNFRCLDGTNHFFLPESIPGNAVIGETPTTPADSNAFGKAGTIRFDQGFLYIHTGTAWKRVALSTF